MIAAGASHTSHKLKETKRSRFQMLLCEHFAPPGCGYRFKYMAISQSHCLHVITIPACVFVGFLPKSLSKSLSMILLETLSSGGTPDCVSQGLIMFGVH